MAYLNQARCGLKLTFTKPLNTDSKSPADPKMLVSKAWTVENALQRMFPQETSHSYYDLLTTQINETITCCTLMDLQPVSHAAKKNKHSLEPKLAASLLAAVSQLASISTNQGNIWL